MEKINIKNFIPCNPNALEEVKAVLKYLSDISGEGIITGQYTDLKPEYEELIKITPTNKLVAITEVGPFPSVSKLSESKIPWCWFMTWSNDFGKIDLFISKEELRIAYHSEYAITLDKLPRLY